MIPPLDVHAKTQIDMHDSCNCTTSCCFPKRKHRHKKTCPEHEKKVHEQVVKINDLSKVQS